MNKNIAIKICGLTREDDARLCADLAVNAIGLVFWSGSKRCVSLSTAEKIIRVCPPFMNIVGLFMDQSAEELNAVCSRLPINTIQLHGQETPDFAESFPHPVIKAFRLSIGEGEQDRQAESVEKQEIALIPRNLFGWQKANPTPHLRGVLLDSGYGGGVPMDWQALRADFVHLPRDHLFQQYPIVLAGGLTPDNVGRAINILHPNGNNDTVEAPLHISAVDVSSGVETAPGIKCPDKMRAFVRSVRG